MIEIDIYADLLQQAFLEHLLLMDVQINLARKVFYPGSLINTYVMYERIIC